MPPLQQIASELINNAGFHQPELDRFLTDEEAASDAAEILVANTRHRSNEELVEEVFRQLRT